MLASVHLAAVLPLLATVLGAPNPKGAPGKTDSGVVERQDTGTFFGVGTYTYVTINGVKKGHALGAPSEIFDLGSGPLDNLEVTIAAYDGATVGTCTLSGTPTGAALFTSDSSGCYARAEADGTQASDGITMKCDPKPEGSLCAA